MKRALTQQAEEKRSRRKTQLHADRPVTTFTCGKCHRECHSCIGLLSHTPDDAETDENSTAQNSMVSRDRRNPTTTSPFFFFFLRDLTFKTFILFDHLVYNYGDSHSISDTLCVTADGSQFSVLLIRSGSSRTFNTIIIYRSCRHARSAPTADTAPLTARATTTATTAPPTLLSGAWWDQLLTKTVRDFVRLIGLWSLTSRRHRSV